MFQPHSVSAPTKTSAKPDLQLYLLGPLRIEQAGEPVRLPRRKVEALLAYLILHPEPQTRDHLATLFWGDTTDDKARHSLRTALATLRQQLGETLVLADRDQVQLNPDYPLYVDLRELLAAGKMVDEIDLTNPAAIHATLELWRGELLAGFAEEWVMAEREYYQTRLRKVLLDLLQRLRTRSEYPQAIIVAQKLLAIDPANEQAHQHLMFCYMALGDRSAALRQYQQCERDLQTELAASPMPETQALYQWIKQQNGADEGLAAKITNLPIPLTTFVGRTQQMRELKWLISPAANRRERQPSRLLTLIGAGGSGKTRLAIQVATDLIDSFVDGVWWVDLTALNDGALVTRAIAKALGVSAANDQKLPQLLLNFLSEKQLLLVVDNCEHLIEASSAVLAELLDNAPQLQILTTSREPLHIAGEMLWHVPTLCLPEQVLLEAPQEADLERLLQSDCLRLFVDRAAAVQQGFRLTAANARTIAQICERLDGIPLAIELAAARVRVLAVEQIADYLASAVGARFDLLTQHKRTLQPRQQTLYAAIDWSYNLLDEPERLLFRLVGVFQGGFTLEALRAILDFRFTILDSSAETASHKIQSLSWKDPKSKIQNILDLLTQLIDKSLVIAEPAGQQQRYRLLESLREYALGQFTAADELADVQARHADYFLGLAEEAAPALRRIEQKLWLDRLTQEYGNLQVALAWFSQTEQTEAGLRMSNALAHFWFVRGYYREGRRWLETFLARTEKDPKLAAMRIDAQSGLAALYNGQSDFAMAQSLLEQTLGLARSMGYVAGIEKAGIGLGVIYWELGDYPAAATLLDEVIQQCRASQHLELLARALRTRSLIHWSLGDLSAAIEESKEALTLAQNIGDVTTLSSALFGLALLVEKRGEYAEARRLYNESIELDRQLGNESHIADALINLGQTALDLGEFAVATTHLQEAAQINRKLADHADVAYSLCSLADIAFYNEQYPEAQRQYQEALPLFRAAGNKRMIGFALAGLGRVAGRTGDFATAATRNAEALTLRQTIGHKVGIIFSLEEGYAELALALGQPAIAARLLAVTDVQFEEMSQTRGPIKTRAVEELFTKVQTQLGEAAFAKAWGEGQLLSLDQAVTLALGIRPPEAAAENEAPLRFYALGPARVYQGKRLLTAADWTYDKARELVFYLLEHPNATQAEIGLHFWPDANSEQVRKRFSAALSHARNALGREYEWITRTDGRYHFDPTRAIWLDVEVFEAKLNAAKLHLQENASSNQALRLLKEATDLYGGDFVEDLRDGEWYQARRTALTQAYLEALVTLAGFYAAAEQWECAISTYQRALAKDPYLEEAHVGLMRSFDRRNQRGQALRQYDTLVAALADLGVVPSAEAQALAQQLRRSTTR